VFANRGSFAKLHCNAPVERWDHDTCVIWKRYNYSLLRVDGVRSIGLTLQFNDIKSTDHGKYFCVLCSDKQCSEGVKTEFDLQVVSVEQQFDI
jgi:Immunoglobulin domain